MKKIWTNHKVYFLLYFLFLGITALILFQYNKQEIHLYLNTFHHSILDIFNKYITYVGDGVTIALATVVLLFVNSKKALQVGISGVVSGIIAQFLKKVVFGPTPRPSAYFKKLDISLHYVEGVELHTAFSFPSGHTTAVFALVTSFVLVSKQKWVDLPLFLLALFAGYSRIYLSQHFLEDVFLGSIIGVTTSVVTYSILFNSKRFLNNKWDKPLINLHKN